MRYPYPIVLNSDIPDEAKRREMVDLCQIACEKHAAAEKSRSERNNQAAATMIKVSKYIFNLGIVIILAYLIYGIYFSNIKATLYLAFLTFLDYSIRSFKMTTGNYTRTIL